MHRPALGSTVPPIQWVSAGISHRKVVGLEAVKVTTHLHLVPRLRISGAILPLDMHRHNFAFICIIYIIKVGQSVCVMLHQIAVVM